MSTQIAFLRGVNLGAHNRIAMADLRALVEGLGYDDARTYLQSGNVVFTARPKPATTAKAIREAIEAELGLSVPVVVRTAAEIATVVQTNVLADVVTDPARYLVHFADGTPDAAGVEALEGLEIAPEVIRAAGREIYQWCPDGVSKSKVKPASFRRLKVPVTGRNWTTVQRVLAMTADM
ncbi:MAG: DUF1697 domain-containing protein [Mycobacteriales bacterium]|nr:MAG: hypothetical protein DLM56_07470 [Pseudonocardiales bacterium]